MFHGFSHFLDFYLACVNQTHETNDPYNNQFHNIQDFNLNPIPYIDLETILGWQYMVT